jgi:hypothetical protein
MDGYRQVQRKEAAAVALSDRPRIPLDKELHDLQRDLTSRHGKVDRQGAVSVALSDRLGPPLYDGLHRQRGVDVRRGHVQRERADELES